MIAYSLNVRVVVCGSTFGCTSVSICARCQLLYIIHRKNREHSGTLNSIFVYTCNWYDNVHIANSQYQLSLYNILFQIMMNCTLSIMFSISASNL